MHVHRRVDSQDVGAGLAGEHNVAALVLRCGRARRASLRQRETGWAGHIETSLLGVPLEDLGLRTFQNVAAGGAEAQHAE